MKFVLKLLNEKLFEENLFFCDDDWNLWTVINIEKFARREKQQNFFDKFQVSKFKLYVKRWNIKTPVKIKFS